MGVFAWFRRKSEKGEQTAEATADAAAADTALTADGGEPAERPGQTAAAPDATDAEERSEETGAEATNGDGALCEAAPSRSAVGEEARDAAPGEAAPGDAAEGVDIPKQQSAGKAADTEAGEGART
ncbi:hypothetical protein [Streptomyces sp. enrichment culture]|uniref:hypothetical protein n=1 Tax=Streptomyces sp. enrichment culture TaxID=1795815 RepID=UPI003F5489CD